MFRRKPELEPEDRFSQLFLRFRDIRAFIMGLQAALTERGAKAVGNILKETELESGDHEDIGQKVKELELKISTIEYFLFGFREAVNVEQQSAITRILSESENASLQSAALGTDPKK